MLNFRECPAPSPARQRGSARGRRWSRQAGPRTLPLFRRATGWAARPVCAPPLIRPMAGGPRSGCPPVVLVVIDKVPEIDAGRSESSCGRLKRDYKGLWGAYSIPSCSNPATANDPQLNRTVELVYNAADIDDANIVWARDMGDKNLELIRYFRDRQVWLVNGSSSPPRLMPYPADSLPAQGDRDTSSSTSH